MTALDSHLLGRNFQALLDVIKARELLDVAKHWHAARGARRMPAWRDIDAVEIGPRLRYVWSWKYDRQTGIFTGRLSGEEIDRAFGKSLRGVAMQDFYRPEAYEVVLPRHLRVVNEPAMMHGHGLVFAHVGRMVVGERIILPLSEDGIEGDGLFGATFYRPIANRSGDSSQCPDFTTEVETFFPLDPA